MRKWDGSFSESKYTETGNIVNNVLENDFRLLHEPTSDGYTHELVAREGYISDDYYFPNKGGGRKAHTHYEFRSNGEVRIDGKIVNLNEQNRRLDAIAIDKKARDYVREGERLHELGEKFEKDKETLEEEIQNIQNSKLSDIDKNELISQLEELILEIQNQYEEDVTEREYKVQKELEGEIIKMQEAADEFEKQEVSLLSLQLDAASVDVSAAANEASAKRQEFEKMKIEYEESMKIQIDQADIQRQRIKGNHL